MQSDGLEWGVDLPITAGLMVSWLVLTLVLMLGRPPAALARVGASMTGEPLIVGGPGDRWRVSFIASIPVGGLLAAMLVGVCQQMIGKVIERDAQALPGVLVSGGFVIWVALMLVPALRGFLHGVELTPSRLLDRGYMRTRVFDRTVIEDVRIAPVGGWASLFFTLMRMNVTNTLCVVQVDGTRTLLLASVADEGRLQHGVDVIRDWLAETESRE
ncbi:hypothetical protein [Microbacterium sp. MYb64]|uniref:hypothetical protein n=1 Tax=Microbacterium sp. MYb64 TaxID=1848691 RepID=UPI000CFC9CCC|nr:hypothetical protein [Microbacterium sp. MYb64]PRB07902.1 hypothetical protein CQ044_04235 [Microbacterium sp. MYb64]